MDGHLSLPDFLVIGGMLAVSASIGIWFRFTGGRQKTTKEFLLAGKDMNVVPVAFSLMATYMSAISLLGVPSETYMYGTQNIMFMVGLPLGAVICAYGFLPIFFDLGAMTAYEYLERRFGKATRTFAAFLFTIQMMLYMAVVLYAPSLALNAVTGLSTWTSVVSLAVVCTFYCSLGGMKAVLWTDVFQSILMYTTIIALVIKACLVYGFDEIHHHAKEGGRFIFFNTNTDLTDRYTVWNCLFNGLKFSLHTFGTNQAQIQRLMSVGTLSKAQKALFLSLPLILLYNLFNYWDGVVIYGMFHDCDPMLDNRTHLRQDQLMPYAIVKLFGGTPGLSGLCIAGVFSASLSTISSAMNSLTAVTIEDFIRPYCMCKKLSETWMTFLAKIIAVVYGVGTLLLVFVVANFRGVIEASNIMFGMIGGPLLGIYTLGMFVKIANQQGSLIGLIVGLVVNAWMGFGSYVHKHKIPTLSRSVEGCTDAFNHTTQNISSIFQPTPLSLVDVTTVTEEEKYIFPVYKVAFLWFPLVGLITVLIVGTIASFFLQRFNKKEVKPEYISPFVRKLYFGTDANEKKKSKTPTNIEMKTNPNCEVIFHQEMNMNTRTANGEINAGYRES